MSSTGTNSTMDSATWVELLVASSVIFIGAAVSAVVNAGFGIYSVLSRSLHQQFAWMNASLAVCDTGALLIFTFWTAPLTLWPSELSVGTIGKKVGQLGMLFWFGSLYNMVAIAFNRFIAISHPTKYKMVFTTSATKKVIVLVWLLALLQTSMYFHPDCYISYIPELFYWSYANTDCGNIVSAKIQDLWLGIGTVVVILGLNCVTLFYLRKNTTQVAAVVQPGQVASRHRKESLFFLQALLNSFFFIWCIINFTLLSTFATNKWALLFTTTLPWLLSHASNGRTSTNSVDTHSSANQILTTAGN